MKGQAERRFYATHGFRRAVKIKFGGKCVGFTFIRNS